MVPRIPNCLFIVSIRRGMTSLRVKRDLNLLILASSMEFSTNQNLKWGFSNVLKKIKRKPFFYQSKKMNSLNR
jgi:hypothetical protein